MTTPQILIPEERITQAILQIRGSKVMLDEDLSVLYGVPTKRLNEQVKRNQDRFPADFMFQLTEEEWTNLKSQSATSSSWGGRRTPPSVFSEFGVAMLSSVLSSERAIQVNIAIMRSFGKLRQMAESHQELARKISDLERRTDSQFQAVFEAIRGLMEDSHTHGGPSTITVRSRHPE